MTVISHETLRRKVYEVCYEMMPSLEAGSSWRIWGTERRWCGEGWKGEEEWQR